MVHGELSNQHAQDPASCPACSYKELAPAEPSFPASPASGTIRCFTPKLTRGHSCDLLEGHPARALSQSWQTLLAICVCPALRLWPPPSCL